MKRIIARIKALNLKLEGLLYLALGLAILTSVAVLADTYGPGVLSRENLGAFSNAVKDAEVVNSEVDAQELFLEINPLEGYEINATYGDIGPKLILAGAIDLEKFKEVYERAGYPLTQDQLKILTQGSNDKIRISQENSYFLLNFFWALGLANKNPILEEGPLMKYGASSIGSFASTGGWTLGQKSAVEIYSKSALIALAKNQQAILEEFAYNSYRPCCNNSTAFADCNHGMAALGLGEIMASQGALPGDIFEALKYANAFWFPQQYLDLAIYFKATQNIDWEEVDARIVVGNEYSTASGWAQAHNWLNSHNLLKQAPSNGGSCGA